MKTYFALRPLSSLLFLMLGLMGFAYAEKADQDKPVILEAEKVSVNEVKQVYDLKGQVLLIKGSIIVTGEDGHIEVDPEGYEFVDVNGTPKKTASFRQRREGPADEFMQGLASNVVYNARTEVLTLTGDASLKRLLNMQMLDQLQGWQIEYEDIRESYKVRPQAIDPNAPPQSRAILAPRKKVLIN